MDLDYTYDNNGNILTETIGSRTDTYTYDALNRLTGVDIPGGTTEDVVYGYDVRGNRTDIDVGGTDNTDLTFNALDLCTRIDFEDGSYKIFVHDNEGNCVSEQYFSGTYLSSPVVVPIDTTQTKEELLADYEEMQAKRKHYPYRYAPKELRTTEYLSPYLPETTDEDFYLNSMLDWTNPALANFKRAERWRPDRNTGNSRNTNSYLSSSPPSPYSPNSTNTTPDEEIVYLYNQENKLIHTILDSGIQIEFAYDGVGRMLKKITTDDTGTDIITTTWKYHHANGKITTIDIDATSTDDSTPPVVTDIRDETLHVYFGPTQLPIGFKLDQYDYAEEETVSETYYYLYDVHGNVIKVIDDTATVKIAYEYDALGKIVTETNPDSIPNPFKWGGAKQTLHNNLINTFSNRAGNYRPDTGTLLGGGAPVFTNPTSGNVLNKMGRSNVSAGQMRSDKQRAMNSGGYKSNVAGTVVISVISATVYLISAVISLWDKFISETDAEKIVRHFQDSTFKAGYKKRDHGYGFFSYHYGMEIHSTGLQNLIGKFSNNESTRLDPTFVGQRVWDDTTGTWGLYTYGGGKDDIISFGKYTKDLSDKAIKLSNKAIGWGPSEGSGSIRYSGAANHGDFQALVVNSAAQFDADNGGANAHCANPSMREQFFEKLLKDIDESGAFTLDNLDSFVRDFEGSFGKLTRSYENEGDIPDILNPDDDGDNIPDSVDDDDDNDGVMDWDEKDGNVGGVGNSYEGATGKGRGTGKGDDGMGGKGNSDNYEEPGPDDSRNPANGNDKGKDREGDT